MLGTKVAYSESPAMLGTKVAYSEHLAMLGTKVAYSESLAMPEWSVKVRVTILDQRI